MFISMNKALLALRHSLHRYPEVSGAEVHTARQIREFVEAYSPTSIAGGVGGHGLLVVYEFGAKGPTVLIRCELDALPIHEVNKFSYRSRHDGVSHKCGHDGHATIVAGLAPWLKQQPFKQGRVVLLFQPAEETGLGAKAMLEDSKFAAIQPDIVFALHNIPGAPMHQVILLPQQFSATVQSVAIRFHGQQSHAAEPENGRNPAMAMAEIVRLTASWSVLDTTDPDFLLITPVYSTLGQREYGISAGYGELHFTLRTWTIAKMEALVAKLEEELAFCCEQFGLGFDTTYFDFFPATTNTEEANRLIREAANNAGLDLFEKQQSFKFGEDFGWFTKEYPGAMFGLGAGLETPVLHNEEYDFPDELIESGLDMFKQIILLGLEND